MGVGGRAGGEGVRACACGRALACVAVLYCKVLQVAIYWHVVVVAWVGGEWHGGNVESALQTVTT